MEAVTNWIGTQINIILVPVPDILEPLLLLFVAWLLQWMTLMGLRIPKRFLTIFARIFMVTMYWMALMYVRSF